MRRSRRPFFGPLADFAAAAGGFGKARALAFPLLVVDFFVNGVQIGLVIAAIIDDAAVADLDDARSPPAS